MADRQSAGNAVISIIWNFSSGQRCIAQTLQRSAEILYPLVRVELTSAIFHSLRRSYWLFAVDFVSLSPSPPSPRFGGVFCHELDIFSNSLFFTHVWTSAS